MTDVCRQARVRQNRIESRCTLEEDGTRNAIVRRRGLNEGKTDPKGRFQHLIEIVFNGPVQSGCCSGEKVLADKTEMEQVVLVQRCEDELEHVEIEIVGGDH